MSAMGGMMGVAQGIIFFVFFFSKHFLFQDGLQMSISILRPVGDPPSGGRSMF